MGEDFGFGFDASDDDPNVKPKNLPVPVESDPATRTHVSVTLKWTPIYQLLEKLTVQAMPFNPKKQAFADGFDAKVGTSVDVPNPAHADSVLVSILKPQTLYVFRLVAKNPAGTTEGPASTPIDTLGPFANYYIL